VARWWQALPVDSKEAIFSLLRVSKLDEAWSMLAFRPSCGECSPRSFGSEVGVLLQGGGPSGVKSVRWFWLAEAIKSVDHPEVLQGRLRCGRAVSLRRAGLTNPCVWRSPRQAESVGIGSLVSAIPECQEDGSTFGVHQARTVFGNLSWATHSPLARCPPGASGSPGLSGRRRVVGDSQLLKP